MVPQLSCRNQEAVRIMYGIKRKQGWIELAARLRDRLPLQQGPCRDHPIPRLPGLLLGG